MLADVLTGQTVDFQSVGKTLPYVGHHQDAPRVLPKSGRLLKTHEPFRPEYLKSVYLVRDFRDVVVSYYRMYRWLGYFRGSLSEFVVDSMDGRVDGFGPWDEHVKSWMAAHSAPGADVLLVRYEDMRHDACTKLSTILAFLGIEHASKDLAAIVERNSVARMREAEQRSLHVRRVAGTGEGRFVGTASAHGWRDALSPHDLERMAPARETLRALGYDEE